MTNKLIKGFARRNLLTKSMITIKEKHELFS